MANESDTHQRLARFAAERPLPRSPEGMALALLDMAALVVACKPQEASRWSKMTLDLQYRRKANPYPGAFLSNPALLLSTQSEGPYGSSHGSAGAGCFFAYPHYHEDSLGIVLLLTAFSPRQNAAARPLRLYAQALKLLVEQGLAQGARASAGEANLDQLAKGGVGRVDYASLSLSFDARGLLGLDRLRTDTGMEAARLALSDDKGGFAGSPLFTPQAREGLERLVARREAELAAEQIASHMQEPKTASPRARSPRV